MFDLNSLFEFSRSHCIAICTILVPANLMATLQTMIFVGLHRSKVQVRQSAAAAIVYAIVMILHVLTWFMIGVIMLPTYVLLWLGTNCLGTNVWALTHSSSMNRLFRLLKRLKNWNPVYFLKHENSSLS